MKFKIITLGCKVNTYESNSISDTLLANGYEKALDDRQADIVIINTCTVTNTANNKSLKMIRHAIRNNRDAIIIVTGCSAQVYHKQIMEIDGVSIIIGTVGKSQILKYIEEYKKNKEQIIDVKNNTNILFEEMKLNNFDKTRAFVKIQDGCNNFCSYCIIPFTRGSVRSRNKDEIINEIKTLINYGHHEIVLTGIHTGNYGEEFDNYDFASLLSDLVKIQGLDRLRISSIEVTELNDRVLSILEKEKVLVSHLHIPLQAGTDKILKAMNRKYDTKYFKEKIDKIRTIRPDISISTDVIVGFPGETEEDFIESMDFINSMKFSKIHVFPYSRRKGTTADLMNNQINEDIKKTRVKRMLEISHELEISYMKKYLNKDVEVLVEKYENGYIMGHTSNYIEVKKIGKCSDVTNIVNAKLKEIDYPIMIE